MLRLLGTRSNASLARSLRSIGAQNTALRSLVTRVASNEDAATPDAAVYFVGEGQALPVPGPVPAGVAEDFKGKSSEMVVFYGDEASGQARRVCLVGLGEPAQVTAEVLRGAAHDAVTRLRALRVPRASFFVPEVDGMDVPDTSAVLAKGAILSNYRFSRKQRDMERGGCDPSSVVPPAASGFAPDADRVAITESTRPLMEELVLGVPSAHIEDVCARVQRVDVVARAVKLARDLTNERSDVVHPSYVQQLATDVAASFRSPGDVSCGAGTHVAPDGFVTLTPEKEEKLRVTVLDHIELRLKGLRMLAAVGHAAKTSDKLPRLVLLEYRGAPESEDKIALVGKGVTHDAGGLNLKPTGFIEKMHMDMAGAAVVLASVKAAAELGLRVNVVGALALAENVIDSLSYKPLEILHSHRGLTVEVGNTDAEGRLCLADAMSFAQATYSPKVMVDVATLTGACVVALGEHAAGLFGNDDSLVAALQQAGAKSQEKLWHMPIFPEHTKEIKDCDVADLSSTGQGREGGACTAAAFLQEFVYPGVAWAHLDVAGPAMPSKPRGFWPQDGTGFGVETLVQWLENQQVAE